MRTSFSREMRTTLKVMLSVWFFLLALETRAQNLVDYSKPASHFPYLVGPYIAHPVPQPSFGNTPRVETLLKDGKLRLSLPDAVTLALENNLDLAIARFNLSIADTDIMRAKSGESVRGVATGLVQGTPGGGVGGFGSGAPGAGAGGTSGGAGGAGTGASGLVQSTLGTGTAVSSYDPFITASGGDEHQTTPLANRQIYGVPLLQLNTGQVSAAYTQSFPTGTNFNFSFTNGRQTTNSPIFNLSPSLTSTFRFQFQQELLAGFGFGPNLRYLRIAQN